LESEGQRDAEINRAEGIKQSQILSSEGKLIETVNKAEGEAKAIMKLAMSRAEAIKEIARAIAGKVKWFAFFRSQSTMHEVCYACLVGYGDRNGVDAVQMAIAERYIDAFGNLAKTNNTMLLPSETGDVSSMVAKVSLIYLNALAIFKAMDIDKSLSEAASSNPPEADVRPESYFKKPVEEQKNQQKEQAVRENVDNSAINSNNNRNV
uniref:Band_7_C domain-containing protein n=1 Tax=Hymenolepis diminuta TaxID=6216 RepID=A0A0R3SES1_HYMDI